MEWSKQGTLWTDFCLVPNSATARLLEGVPNPNPLYLHVDFHLQHAVFGSEGIYHTALRSIPLRRKRSNSDLPIKVTEEVFRHI